MARAPTLNEYFVQNLPLSNAKIVLQRFKEYQTHTSPKQKLAPLFDYLGGSALKIEKVMDFGFGRGYIASSLFRMLGPEAHIVAYDPDENAIPCVAHPNIDWRTDLDKCPLCHCDFDLIIVIHTLQHLSPFNQIETIKRLLKSLKQSGILYIYEDSWKRSGCDLRASSMRDEQFNCLREEEKHQLFRRNEYWSNSWCYNRIFDIANVNYRSLEQWETIVKECGGSVVASSAMGFNRRRLHGVPSAWLIANPCIVPV
jgi:hypothetical protein